MLNKDIFAKHDIKTKGIAIKQSHSNSSKEIQVNRQRAEKIAKLEKSARILGQVLKTHPELSSNCQKLYALAHLKTLGLAQF